MQVLSDESSSEVTMRNSAAAGLTIESFVSSSVTREIELGVLCKRKNW